LIADRVERLSVKLFTYLDVADCDADVGDHGLPFFVFSEPPLAAQNFCSCATPDSVNTSNRKKIGKASLFIVCFSVQYPLDWIL
jgi:hypothetical protein